MEQARTEGTIQILPKLFRKHPRIGALSGIPGDFL